MTVLQHTERGTREGHGREQIEVIIIIFILFILCSLYFFFIFCLLFCCLETKRSCGKKKIWRFRKIKNDDVDIYFTTSFFLTGNERGKALSRPAQPDSPPPFSSSTTCEARDEETIIQCGSFFDSIFSSSASLVFFFFRFRSYFEVEISFSFFFLFSWALTLV